jgi:hypothetical protein
LLKQLFLVKPLELKLFFVQFFVELFLLKQLFFVEFIF